MIFLSIYEPKLNKEIDIQAEDNVKINVIIKCSLGFLYEGIKLQGEDYFLIDEKTNEILCRESTLENYPLGNGCRLILESLQDRSDLYS